MYNSNKDVKSDISVKEYFENLSKDILVSSQSSNTEDNSGSWYEMANWFQWVQAIPR